MPKAKVQSLVLPFNLAQELKNLGFNDQCVAIAFDDGFVDFGSVEYCNVMVGKNTGIECVQTPLWDQAIDWFNDHHKIRLNIIHRDSNGLITFDIWYWDTPNNIGKWERVFNPQSWQTREEARYEGMKQCMKMLAHRIETQQSTQ